MTDEQKALRDKAIERHRLNPGTELLDAAIAVALEKAAKVIENDCHDDMTRDEEAAAIRALIPKETA